MVSGRQQNFQLAMPHILCKITEFPRWQIMLLFNRSANNNIKSAAYPLIGIIKIKQVVRSPVLVRVPLRFILVLTRPRYLVEPGWYLTP